MTDVVQPLGLEPLLASSGSLSETCRPVENFSPSTASPGKSWDGPDPALQLETLVASLRSSTAQAQMLKASLVASEMDCLRLRRLLRAVRAEHAAQMSIAAAAAQAANTTAAARQSTIQQLERALRKNGEDAERIRQEASTRDTKICQRLERVRSDVDGAASSDAGATLSALQASTALVADMQSMFRDLQRKLVDQQQDNERLKRQTSALQEALLQSERREAEAESRARVLAMRLELEEGRPSSRRPDGDLSVAVNGNTRENEGDDGACLAAENSRNDANNELQRTPSGGEQLTPREGQAEHGVAISKSERGFSCDNSSDQRSRQRLPQQVWLESDDSDAWDDDSDDDSTPRGREERAWPSRSFQGGSRLLSFRGREDMLRMSSSAAISRRSLPQDDKHITPQSTQPTATYMSETDNGGTMPSPRDDLAYKTLTPESSYDAIPKSAAPSSSPEEVSGSRSAGSIQRTSTPSSPSIDFALQDLAAAIAGLEVHLGTSMKPRHYMPGISQSPLS